MIQQSVMMIMCLLVLDSVTSTPQWILQPKPRDDVHDVCVLVCKCVLRRSRDSQPLNILAYEWIRTSRLQTLSVVRLQTLSVVDPQCLNISVE
jgi:hypothetical protein